MKPVATNTRILTPTVINHIPIIIDLDFYAKVDIINYQFTLQYWLKQVAKKTPLIRYIDGLLHETFNIYEILIQVCNNRNYLRSLIIYYTIVKMEGNTNDLPVLLGIPTLSEEAILLFPKKRQ